MLFRATVSMNTPEALCSQRNAFAGLSREARELKLRATYTADHGIVSNSYVRSHDVGWMVKVAESLRAAHTAHGCAISCGRLTCFVSLALHSLDL